MADDLDPRTFPDDAEPAVLWIDPDNGIFCLLDQIDYEWAVRWAWSYTLSKEGRKTYATRKTRIAGRQVKLYLHKEILKRKQPVPPSPQHSISDHRNSNSLDNTRANLRWATPSMNRLNLGGIAALQSELFGEAA